MCENLQCIYPLGSKPLNNLISPNWKDRHTPNKPQKRKLLETNYKDSPPLADSKKIKDHIGIGGEQVLNSEHDREGYDEIPLVLPDSLSSDQQNLVRTGKSLEQDEILEAAVVDMAAEDATPVDVSGIGEPAPQNEGGTSDLDMPLESKCTSASQTCVQWKNSYALCWLDCILSVLVHLERIRKAVMTDLCSKEDSVFWRLFMKYKQASTLHTSQVDGVQDEDYKKISSEIFAKIETCLNEVRDEIFIRLQPQLRCTLGDMESPVFAFPLLLKIEPCIEKLFTYSFSWNFECSQCGHKYQNRCMKNLVTFTNVIPEWHPLNAAHFGPCNNCNNKSQIRKMVLEKVSPIFMLHFVEGLPCNDLQPYSFPFEGCLYQITSVIQYQANNHFITWILDADGSWLECDDLKGTCSERREKFDVPPSEIHIVIWERKTSQMTDEAPACLPLQKTSDEHAFGDEKPVPPAWCSVGDTASSGTTSGSHPTNVAVAPNTLSQDEAVAHGHHLLSGSKGLVDNNILLLTLEEKQVNAEGFLLGNTPVAKTGVVGRTNTLQSQESLMASLVSAPCQKLAQELFVELSFPSQTVTTHTPSVQPHADNPALTKPATEAQATAPLQGGKSLEIEGAGALEKDAPLKQLLSPKTEKLKLEHVTPQVSHLKKRETEAFCQTITAKSLQSSPLKENQKKPFVGSWVKGLLSKGASFMPPCVSAHSRTAVTDLQPSVKGASNFGGFKTKGKQQKAKRAFRKARRSASQPPAASAPQASWPPSGSTAPAHAHVPADPPGLRTCEDSAYRAPLNPSCHGNGGGVFPANLGDSVEGQIHKLRLKLLKKLKAKKKKLAALTSSPQNGKLPSENLEPVSHCGSPNDDESIEDLLKELQFQINIADSKSGGTTIPSGSPYGGQTHEEILAELLSPTTVVSAELSENGEADLRYLEVGDNHTPAPGPEELNYLPQDTHLRQDHNYCSPTKKTQGEVQPDSLTQDACVRMLNLESSMKTDIFDDFFSTSALNSLANDTLDLPYFDEYLFESC